MIVPIATSTIEHSVLPSQSVTDDSSTFIEDDEDDDETEGQELFLDGETSYAALASLASTARTNAPSAVTAPPSSPSSVRSRLKLRRLLSAPLVPTSSSFLRDTYDDDDEEEEEEEDHNDERHKTNRNHRVDELDRRLSHLAGMVRSLLDEKDARKDTVTDYREQQPHHQQQQQQQQSMEMKLRKVMEKRMQRFERTLMDKFKRERNALRAENKRMKKQLGAIRVQNDHFRERLDRVENDPVVPCRDGIVVMKGRGSPSTEDTEEEKHEEEEEEEKKEEEDEDEEEDVGVVDVVLKSKTDNNNNANDDKTTVVEESGKHHEHEDHAAFVTDDCVSAVPVPIMASSGQDHPQDRWKRDSMFIREENKIIKEQNSLLLEKCEWLCEQVLSMKDSMVLLSGEGTSSPLDWDSSYGYDWDDHSLRKGKSVRFALDESQEHYSDHSLSQHRQRYSDATPAAAVVDDDGFEERRSSPPRLPSRPQLQQQQRRRRQTKQQQGWQEEEDVLQSDVFVSFLPNDFCHQ